MSLFKELGCLSLSWRNNSLVRKDGGACITKLEIVVLAYPEMDDIVMKTTMKKPSRMVNQRMK